MIELKFNSDDPKVIRNDMMAMLGMDAACASIHETGLQQGAQIGGEASDRTDSTETVTGETAAAKPGRRGRTPKVSDAVVAEEPKQNISTGAERGDPEAAAPAAEEKQPEPAAKVLTLDDVRNAAGEYVTKFGLEHAQVDLMPCLKAAVGVERISELTGKDQETLEKAVKAFKAAAASDTRYGQIA